MRATAWMVVATIAAIGCARSDPDTATQVAPATIPTPPALTDAAGPYALRYFAPASGQLIAVKTAADVPDGARAQVLVAWEDPALQGPWLYVADLTHKQGTGYAVRSVDRAELEAQVAAAAPKAAPPAAGPNAGAQAAPAAAHGAAPSADSDVVIYRTAWCGYCKKAAEYLRLKGVSFVEKDLERDAGARDDMVARARRAGVDPGRLQGVPILSVRGKIINGFDRGAIDRALGG